MKLKHLLQSYNANNISATIDIDNNKTNQIERAGVISYLHLPEINSSYLLDDEGYVIAMSIVSNCYLKEKSLEEHIEHAIDTLTIIQKTMIILANLKQSEANTILKELNMLDGNKIETRTICYLNFIYKVEVVGGLLMFSIIEREQTEKLLKNEKVSQQ